MRGAGSSIEGNYLVNHGLGECLTHFGRFLGGLVGREEVKFEMMRDSPLEHRFLKVGDDVWGTWD